MNDAMERLKARQGQSGTNILDAIMPPVGGRRDDVTEIPADKLHGFANHTFRLRPMDDPYMLSLLDSIKTNGILEPLIVRPHPLLPGEYEIIAGHTRYFLGCIAAMSRFPCVVRDLDDADAVIQMGETNVQRPDWLPSEKAKTYKAHLDAIRQKRNSGDVAPGSPFVMGEKSRDIAAKRWGITGKALEMYIRLNELEPELLKFVDEGRIPVKAGDHLAYLRREEQKLLCELMKEFPSVKVNVDAAVNLRLVDPVRQNPQNEFPRVLGLDGTRQAKTATWSIALPRELLPKEAKQYLGEPELQERLVRVVNAYISECMKAPPVDDGAEDLDEEADE